MVLVIPEAIPCGKPSDNKFLVKAFPSLVCCFVSLIVTRLSNDEGKEKIDAPILDYKGRLRPKAQPPHHTEKNWYFPLRVMAKPRAPLVCGALPSRDCALLC